MQIGSTRTTVISHFALESSGVLKLATPCYDCRQLPVPPHLFTIRARHEHKSLFLTDKTPLHERRRYSLPSAALLI